MHINPGLGPREKPAGGVRTAPGTLIITVITTNVIWLNQPTGPGLI